MWLFLIFVGVPLVEIALFIQVGGAIGLWPTLAIVIATAVLGTWLVRAQGVLALANLRQSFSRLNDPTEPLAHGAMILVAGALLLTPGFFTDAVGFSLLLPPVRSALFNWVKQRVKVQQFSMGPDPYAHRDQNRGPVIDGVFEEVDPRTQKTTESSGWTKH